MMLLKQVTDVREECHILIHKDQHLEKLMAFCCLAAKVKPFQRRTKKNLDLLQPKKQSLH